MLGFDLALCLPLFFGLFYHLQLGFGQHGFSAAVFSSNASWKSLTHTITRWNVRHPTKQRYRLVWVCWRHVTHPMQGSPKQLPEPLPLQRDPLDSSDLACAAQRASFLHPAHRTILWNDRGYSRNSLWSCRLDWHSLGVLLIWSIPSNFRMKST